MMVEQKKHKEYDVALATRNFEIELFWKRALFFWGFIASSFIGYATLVRVDSSLAIVIACFGFVSSFAWTLVNRGSKRWQENWEMIISKMDHEITDSLFEKRGEKIDKTFWLSARKFSVSKVTIALSDFTVLVWLFLMICHVIKLFSTPIHMPLSCVTILTIFGTLVFAGFMFKCSRSSD